MAMLVKQVLLFYSYCWTNIGQTMSLLLFDKHCSNVCCSFLIAWQKMLKQVVLLLFDIILILSEKLFCQEKNLFGKISIEKNFFQNFFFIDGGELI